MSTSTSPAAAPGAPRSGVRMRTYYWIVAPMVLLFAFFHTFPVLTGVFYSFTNYAGFGDWKFIGLSNYANLFRDDRVLGAQASVDLAEALNCPCYIYEGYGHGVYDEAPDYLARISAFLKGE